MIEMKKSVKPGKTPAEITVTMIDQDLKDGISKPEMVIKYGVRPWEVDEMFKHPFLKGRRPARKRTLSFNFVDDMTDLPLNSGDIAVEQAEEVDPNQVTLEDAITEATQDTQNALNSIKQTNDVIADMLSPTDPEETIESLINEVETEINDRVEKHGIGEIEEEEEEEEVEVENDTFEL